MSKAESKLSISKKIANLDEQVEWFYGDDFDLDKALNNYQDAMKAAQEIEKDLDELKNQVTVIEDFTKD